MLQPELDRKLTLTLTTLLSIELQALYIVSVNAKPFLACYTVLGLLFEHAALFAEVDELPPSAALAGTCTAWQPTTTHKFGVMWRELLLSF